MTQGIKTWNVRLHRAGVSKDIGQVQETNEELARCAALSKFGISEEDAAHTKQRDGIREDDDFDVSPA